VERTTSRNWRLEDFLDSLIGELDQAQDVLALKGVNRPLTYTVKEIALELQLFPVYSGESVLWATAKPGETGASKINIALGSITDRQIRETTRPPTGEDDVSVELVEEIDPDTRRTLKKIGVKSVKDLARMEDRKIDLSRTGGKGVNYKDLAQAIAKAKRGRSTPRLSALSVEPAEDGFMLSLSGENLMLVLDAAEHDEFPLVMLNRKAAPVVAASEHGIDIALSSDHLVRGSNELAIALDPYSIIRVDVKV
jgi:hypothetical protein